MSIVQLSNSPLPLRSRYHCPVLGRNTPILAIDGLVAPLKVAVQLLLALMVTLTVVVVAVQPVPVQPAKVVFAAGAAVRTTAAPLA